jgi:hypothetical protein
MVVKIALLLLLTCQAASAGPLDDRFTIRAEGGFAFRADGYTRLRQFDTPGDRLDLREDLGLSTWYGVSIEAAWRFDAAHAVSAAFDWNGFRGENSIEREVTHEGATFASGTQLDFDRTRWWRVQAWYHFTAWNTDVAAITLLAGVPMDFADVYVVAEPGPIAGERDDHENFGTQAMPMPAIGARFDLTPIAGLRLAGEVRGTWIENLPTWHGDTRHSQTALDARIEVSYRVTEVELGLALQHQALYLKQDNREDGNELLLQGTFLKLFIRVWL